MPRIQARQHTAGQAQGPSPGLCKMPAGQAVASEAPSAVSLPMHHGCRNAQWSCLGQASQPTCSDACRISRLRLSMWVTSASLSSVVSRPARSLALSWPCVALAACEYDSLVFTGPFGPPVAQNLDSSGMQGHAEHPRGCAGSKSCTTQTTTQKGAFLAGSHHIYHIF